MSLCDLDTLTGHVCAILADPQADVPLTGRSTLDDALKALRQHRRSQRPLVEPHALGYWYVDATATRAHAR